MRVKPKEGERFVCFSHVASTDDPSSPEFRGTLHCLMKLLRDGGIEAWSVCSYACLQSDHGRFKGLTSKIIHIVLVTAFGFVAYEKIVAVWL
jgi:hypothetical protein